MTKKSKRKSTKKHAKKAAKTSTKDKEQKLEKSLFPRIKLIHVAMVILAIVIIYLIVGRQSAEPTTEDGKVKVEFYVMSQCPFGTQVVDAIAPVMENMGDGIDLHIEYIVSEIAPGNFQSLHGEPEVKGNIVQLCAKQYNPDKYIDFIVCQNKNAAAIPGNWESCVESEGLDKENIQTCYEGDEGEQLLSASAGRANKANAKASPTIFIGERSYSGARDSLSFQRAICQLSEHEACAEMPACASDMDCIPDEGKVAVCIDPNTKEAVCEQKEPIKVGLVVLNDKDCTTCDTSQILEVTKQLFAGLETMAVDISSEEGKALVEDLGITVVPAFIFDSTVKDTYGWKQNPQIYGAFEDKGDFVRLKDEATGASHFVDGDARTAFYETIGVTLGDNTPQIDFFVMSYCPYGNQAEEIIEEVYDNLGDAVEFIPHYVYYSNYQGGGPQYCFDEASKYCSMHGVTELNQDLREMCVYNHVGIKEWFEFARAMNSACNYNNADTCWEGVADDLGLDKDVITTCFDEEALDMLEKDWQLSQTLKVTGSPTVFIDGAQYDGARDANAMKGALCSAFDGAKPSGCAKTIASSASTAAATTDAGCGV